MSASRLGKAKSDFQTPRLDLKVVIYMSFDDYRVPVLKHYIRVWQ